MMKILVFIVIAIAGLSGCNNQSSSKSDLKTTSKDRNNSDGMKDEQLFQNDKERLKAEGWDEQYIQNGKLPDCYNFDAQQGIVDNFLEVVVGSGTDIAIKIMHLPTNKCVRYVFINSGSIYSIDSIPEGKYYLKIAYGKNWLSKIENGHCIGKFSLNPIYEKGEDTLDYFVQYSANGYNIPSYRLQLDVISNNITNSFSSHNISESEFNE